MRKIRILVAKVGCDIHERGALTMMTVYRDAGMETIYTGRFQSEEGVVNAAINENVDFISVSDLTGSLVIICKKLMDGLKEQGAENDIHVICGGIITDSDRVGGYGCSGRIRHRISGGKDCGVYSGLYER